VGLLESYQEQLLWLQTEASTEDRVNSLKCFSNESLQRKISRSFYVCVSEIERYLQKYIPCCILTCEEKTENRDFLTQCNRDTQNQSVRKPMNVRKYVAVYVPDP